MSKFINVALALGVFALSAAWVVSGMLMPEETTVEEEEVETPVEVVTMPLRYADYVSTVRLSGRTEAQYSVNVTARTAGVVIDLPAREGAFVEAGDVIAQLSDEARAAAVSEARAAIDEARAQLRAGEELAQRGFLPALELELRRANLAAAESALERALTEAERGVVVAPVSGVLDRLVAEPGQSVAVGDQIATVLDLDPIIVVAYASERAVHDIAVGADAKAATLNGRTFDAEVVLVSRAAEAATRTFRVEAQAPNPEAEIIAGLTAEVLIETPPRPAARIARSAITLNAAGEIGVMLVDKDSRAEFAAATIVGDEGEVFWIEGPPPESEVIVVGQEFVAPGARVHAVRRAPGGGVADVAALTE